MALAHSRVNSPGRGANMIDGMGDGPPVLVEVRRRMLQAHGARRLISRLWFCLEGKLGQVKVTVVLTARPLVGQGGIGKYLETDPCKPKQIGVGSDRVGVFVRPSAREPHRQVAQL